MVLNISEKGPVRSTCTTFWCSEETCAFLPVICHCFLYCYWTPLKEPGFLLSASPVQVYYTLTRSSINILFLRLNSLCSHPLHTGEMLQPPSKFLWSFSELSPVAPCLSGTGSPKLGTAPSLAYIFNSFLLYYYRKHYMCNYDSIEGNRKGACLLTVFSEQD